MSDLVYPSEDALREYALSWRGKFYSHTSDGGLIQREGCFKGKACATGGSSIVHPNIEYTMMMNPAPDVDLVIIVDADREADYE